jgi:signal transduction histidine kinase
MNKIFKEEPLISLDLLQEKTTRIFALLSSALMLFLGFSDLVMGLQLEIVLFKFAFAIPFFAGYLIMKKLGRYQLVLSGMMVFAFVIIALNYYYNDGFEGPTVYTIFMLVMTITILFNGGLKYFWLIAAFLFFISLMYSDLLGGAEIVSNYLNSTARFGDHVITILWCCLFVFLGIQLFIFGYKRQNQVLTKVMEANKKANIELEELNTKKNELIALLSHDLKNPISTLNQTVELVELGGLEEGDFESVIKELKKQSFHLTNVLNNTLSWVLTELDQGVIVQEEVDLAKLNEEMVQTMQVQANQKGQVIVATEKGEVKTAQLEANEVKIILKNFLDNAIKFSPNGAQIELDLNSTNGSIRWEVKNEGPTVPLSLRDGLFEFKVRTSYGTNKEKGTGMGLPLCKKIADKLEMKLGFETQGDNLNVFYLERKTY